MSRVPSSNPGPGFVFFREGRFDYMRSTHELFGEQEWEQPVAQKVQVLLLDDLDGGEADETVTFALDGKTYEIDLNAANADKLRSVLETYIQAGRKAGGRSGRGRGGRTAAPSGGSQDTAKIRAWAKEQGYDVNDRGRVPASIREAYEKAGA
ncbi:hypothetical protein GCM10009716_39480 [Streptomyces sodiiphilus]|uniref:Lsr2 family protein n=1 Tax=Streptomyces sodiiphilus TaxID=226217 RepID=A0ABN2PPA1_9ACTN